MSKGDSTRKRSFIGKALVLIGALFASVSIDKAALSKGNRSNHAMGAGWGGGAVYTPKRTKFKGYMRNKSSFNKNK